jgi:hypothetical protein
MSNTKQFIPKLYREAAEEVRQLAARSRLTDIRGDLLELSARFERLGAYAEAAISHGSTGFPHGELLPVADDRPHDGHAAYKARSRAPGRPPPQRSETSHVSANKSSSSNTR